MFSPLGSQSFRHFLPSSSGKVVDILNFCFCFLSHSSPTTQQAIILQWHVMQIDSFARTKSTIRARAFCPHVV